MRLSSVVVKRFRVTECTSSSLHGRAISSSVSAAGGPSSPEPREEARRELVYQTSLRPASRRSISLTGSLAGRGNNFSRLTSQLLTLGPAIAVRPLFPKYP